MRIAVVGAQNVGKTTFVKDFVSAFPNYSTPNVSYRDVVLAKGLKINQETTVESQLAIRDFIYSLISESKEENIIFDRCLIDNFVYSYCAFLKGNIKDEFINESKEKVFEHLKYLDQIIFIPTALNINLEDDKLRDTDKNFVDLVNRVFIEILLEIASKNIIPIKVISGAREERVGQIKNLVNL
jgi:GTPase SAR1 family protein